MALTIITRVGIVVNLIAVLLSVFCIWFLPFPWAIQNLHHQLNTFPWFRSIFTVFIVIFDVGLLYIAFQIHKRRIGDGGAEGQNPDRLAWFRDVIDGFMLIVAFPLQNLVDPKCDWRCVLFIFMLVVLVGSIIVIIRPSSWTSLADLGINIFTVVLSYFTQAEGTTSLVFSFVFTGICLVLLCIRNDLEEAVGGNANPTTLVGLVRRLYRYLITVWGRVKTFFLRIFQKVRDCIYGIVEQFRVYLEGIWTYLGGVLQQISAYLGGVGQHITAYLGGVGQHITAYFGGVGDLEINEEAVEHIISLLGDE